MISIHTQIHGYRQGHQLLASSLGLSKLDQAIIDRLSDVAGPLRPGERFDPYISAYPLPSGSFFVLARTWQDLSVPRAGCVRTYSLLIPMLAWESARALQPFLDLLDPKMVPSEANPLSVRDAEPVALPQAPSFRAGELLEAMFLEDPKPIVLFNAPQPELIANRLVTALWPALRRRFALSTFALSPRKIEGRGFDLVFAPKDARPRFADWPGRRIDAREGEGARHRWTGEIVDRVFKAPMPWLLTAEELSLIGPDESVTPAALRIALLWDELFIKLAQSPSAALGLLDIANSKMQSDSEAVLALQPALADAARRAVASMPANEAWDLIGAMVRKMDGTRLDEAFSSVANASATLAGMAPTEAIAFLDHYDNVRAVERLTPAIAAGLAGHLGPAAERALGNSKPASLARVVAADQHLAQLTATRPILLQRLAAALAELDALQFAAVRDAVINFVVSDEQIVLARPLIGSLDKVGLLAQVRRLADANALSASSFLPLLASRAREISAIGDLREALLNYASSAGRDQLLGLTLEPVAADARWLLDDRRLDRDTSQQLLHNLLRAADSRSFCGVLSNTDLAPSLVEAFAEGAHDLLGRAVNEAQLPLDLYITAGLRLMQVVPKEDQLAIARQILDRCLQDHFSGDEIATLTLLLNTLGARLDGAWAVRRGLERGVPTSVLSRNIVSFNQASKAARQRIVEAVFTIAQTITERPSVDLDDPAADACAQLLWDAQLVNEADLLRGAGRLLPVLLNARRAPISPLVASTFPLVYRELAKKDDVPDILKFVPFLDWDRCKAARRELVDAFISAPAWRPRDLALTACRVRDVGRILRRIGKAYGGDAYVSLLLDDLGDLPSPCRDEVRRTITQIRSEWSDRYDWRD